MADHTPPRDAPSTVRVWLIGEDLAPAAFEKLSGVLDAGERDRAGAYVSAVERRRFVIAHGAMRHIVAGQLGAEPQDLRWSPGRHGKPELTGRWTGVRANLSHSGGFSMVAVTRGRAVGVDIEAVPTGMNPISLATRYFPAAESSFVAAGRDPAERAERFAGLWARKEALSKALGGRLIPVLGVPVLDVAVAHPAESAASSRGYRIADVDAPPGFRAAVALAGSGPYTVDLQRWQWHAARPAQTAQTAQTAKTEP